MLVIRIEFIVSHLKVGIGRQHDLRTKTPAAGTIAPAVVAALEGAVAVGKIKMMPPEYRINRSIATVNFVALLALYSALAKYAGIFTSCQPSAAISPQPAMRLNRGPNPWDT